MERWPDSTPISKVVHNLEDLNPTQKHKLQVVLEQNLILNLGLLKRIRPDRIHRLEMPEQAKQQLQKLITHLLQDNFHEPNITGPFLFKQNQMELFPSCGTGDAHTAQDLTHDTPFARGVQVTKSSLEEESSEESDSEDSLDEYLRQWGVSLPKEKGAGGSCPFIFQRMMVERRRLLEAQKNEETQNGEITDKCPNMGKSKAKPSNVDRLSPALMKEAEEKCPHFTNTGRDILKTEYSHLNGLSEDIKKEAIAKCPHFAHLKT